MILLGYSDEIIESILDGVGIDWRRWGGPSPTFGPMTQEQWDTFVDQVRFLFPPHERCGRARPLSLGVLYDDSVYPAGTTLADDNEFERNRMQKWWTYLPTPAVDGQGPYTWRLLISSPTTNGLYPNISVYVGCCDDEGSALATAVQEQEPGCYEFESDAGERIYVVLDSFIDGYGFGDPLVGRFTVETGSCIVPFTTCAEAAAGPQMANGVTYGPFTLTTGSHFFQGYINAGAYSITVVAGPMNGQTNITTKETCASETPDIADVLRANESYTFTGNMSAAGMIIQVSIGTSDTVTYTIRFDG